MVPTQGEPERDESGRIDEELDRCQCHKLPMEGAMRRGKYSIPDADGVARPVAAEGAAASTVPERALV